MQSVGGLFLILITTTTVAEALFTPDQQLVYQYHAVVQAGTSVPSQASSNWELRGKLVVQAQQNVAVMQLSKLTTSLHNGKLPSSSNHAFHPSPPEIAELLQPFEVHYENNKVQGITVSGNEPLWSVNIKRALANLLQLDESQFDLTAFITQENTLYGECRTEYSISEESGKIIARKFTDISEQSCKGFPKLSWSNVSPILCKNGPQLVSTSAGRKYTLVRSERGDLILENVQSRGGTNVQPFQALGEIQYAITKQTLELETRENIAELLKVQGNSQRVGLTFELPRSDPSQGRAPINDKIAIKLVDEILEKLSDSVETNPFSVEPDELHDQYVTHLLYYLSLLDKPALEQYYQSLAIGTSYHQESIRNLFLKLLPQVGSNASVLFIRDLVDRIKDNSTAIELLTVLPFYVRHPSEELLKECEKLLFLGDNVDSQVKSAAILSFATLIHKTCRQSCQSATLDRYTRKFVDLFSGSKSYEEQILYLEALNNIELGDVYDYVEPIIRGNVTIFTHQPHHIRFLGVWATMSAAYNPYKTLKIYQTYWPILTNRSEHLEMRVAALTMLMLSGPTHANFFNLLWFMESEPNAHLQHFFYTTLISLIDTTYPCYTGLGAVASHVIRFVKPPSASNWATGNYILDYTDPQYGFGGMTQLFAVANQRTGNPNILHLVLSNYVLGYTVQQLELYLKLEGVADVFKKYVLDGQIKIETLSEVIALLKQLKAPIITPEPIHIEIITKIEGKVIMCHYINRDTFHKFAGVITQIEGIIHEFHINYQSVKAPLLVEMIQPADIGVPLYLRLDSSALFSIRGNFTRDTTISPFTRKNQVDLRSSLNAHSSLVVYNPILNLWHGVTRSHSYQSYIPINNKITINLSQRQIRISFTKPLDFVGGFLAHAQSAVEIRGTDSAQILKQFCFSCKTKFIVNKDTDGTHTHDILNETINSLGIRLGASVFDCDHPYSSADYFELIQLILSEENKNYRVLPPVRYSLGFTHLLDLLTLVPPDGSCGLQVQLASTDQEATEIEAVVSYKKDQVSSDTTKYETSLSLSHKIQNSQTPLQEWLIATIHKISQDGTKRNFRLRLAHALKGKQDHKLCLDSEIRMPKADDGVLLPWTPSEPATAKINLIWGNTEGSSKCPQEGLEVNVVATGETTEEQRALVNSTSEGAPGTYWRDTKNIVEWGEEYTPITGACYQAAYELATLRKYIATIKYKHVPKIVSSTSTRAGALLEVLHPGVTSNIKDSNLILSLEVPVLQPDVKLAINKQQVYINHAKSWIEPLLMNTRFSPMLPIAMKLSFIGSCIVNSARVISFDGITNNFNTSCYTLIAADCTPQPKFAVLARKISDGKLAVKVYLEGNEIDIIPDKNGKLQVSVNDQHLKLEGKDYYYPPNKTTYVFKVHLVDNGQVRVTSDNFWLQHNGPFLILVSYVGQKGQLCGLCGDFNGDSSNDISQALSLPC